MAVKKIISIILEYFLIVLKKRCALKGNLKPCAQENIFCGAFNIMSSGEFY